MDNLKQGVKFSEQVSYLLLRFKGKNVELNFRILKIFIRILTLKKKIENLEQK